MLLLFLIKSLFVAVTAPRWCNKTKGRFHRPGLTLHLANPRLRDNRGRAVRRRRRAAAADILLTPPPPILTDRRAAAAAADRMSASRRRRFRDVYASYMLLDFCNAVYNEA